MNELINLFFMSFFSIVVFIISFYVLRVRGRLLILVYWFNEEISFSVLVFKDMYYDFRVYLV